jgi:RNA recognition motif-containing protein
MEDEACGRAAITMLNGRTIRGNVVTVEESWNTDEGPSVPSTRLRVKNLPNSMTAAGLRDLFVKYGMIIAAEITNGEGIVVREFNATEDIRS